MLPWIDELLMPAGGDLPFETFIPPTVVEIPFEYL